MNHALAVALVAGCIVLVPVTNASASGRPGGGVQEHFAAVFGACRLLALPRRQWQAMLDWQAEGIISSQSIIALIDAPRNPCLPISKKYEKSLKRPSGR